MFVSASWPMRLMRMGWSGNVRGTSVRREGERWKKGKEKGERKREERVKESVRRRVVVWVKSVREGRKWQSDCERDRNWSTLSHTVRESVCERERERETQTEREGVSERERERGGRI